MKYFYTTQNNELKASKIKDVVDKWALRYSKWYQKNIVKYFQSKQNVQIEIISKENDLYTNIWHITTSISVFA